MLAALDSKLDEILRGAMGSLYFSVHVILFINLTLSNDFPL